MLQAYQVKGQDSHDGTSSGPVLWGVAWHPSATPEEVHFKMVQMGSWAALFFFFFFFLNFMYGCVACIYVCACVCLVSVASKVRSCCVPLAAAYLLPAP